MPVHVIQARQSGKTDAAHVCSCQRCGALTTRLFHSFTNGIGWRLLCARCANPERGPARPASHLRPVRHLRIVGGAARP